MVSAMAALVAILIGLTFFNSVRQPQAQPDLSESQSIFSPESVMFERNDPAEERVDYDLVLATVYDSEEADGKQR